MTPIRKIARKPARKHILCIESVRLVALYPDWHPQMVAALEKLFVVTWGLGNNPRAAVEECLTRGGPDGIVSNAGGLRGDTLDPFRLQEQVPIVAFTGALGPDLIPIYGQADTVLLKKANIPEDINQIHAALTRLWKERRKAKPPTPPEIRTEEGHTTAEAVVRIAGRLGLIGSYLIALECRQYQRAITFARTEESKVAATFIAARQRRLRWCAAIV